MGKIIGIISVLTVCICADSMQPGTLNTQCLDCHRQQQIPGSLVYKRYLMKYSTDARMEKAIFSYLKNPDKEHSIMPAPFFSKFSMKQKMDIDDEALHRLIKNYLERFNMKKKFVLEKAEPLTE